MEEGKKSFFELLDSKSALIVGAVGGLLSLGTIGFIILGAMALNGSVKLGGANSAAGTLAQVAQQPAAGQPADNTPPPNVPKADKPKVELFVMAYCPFGLQMEKAFLPAMELLKSKADISVKFVSYAMHGKKEVDENTRQYCIEKEQPAKYAAYLSCFFGAGQNDGSEANYQSCLSKAGISEGSISGCVNSTDKQFGITAKYNDKSTWLSGQYPLYPVHDDLNQKYGVQGSPTLVINGVQADAARTPEAVKQAICASFNNAPSECGQTLPATQFQAGFGLASAGAAVAGGAAQPGCGT